MSLIDDEVTLGWWTSPDGIGGEPISLSRPRLRGVCHHPERGLAPYQSEYEGYMGNYGNTLDRWYRPGRGRRVAARTGRSRRVPRPDRSGRSRSSATVSTPETWMAHVPQRSRSRRSGKRLDAQAGLLGAAAGRGGGPGRRRDGGECCFNRSVCRRSRRSMRAGWPRGRAVRRGLDARASSTGGSGRGTTSEPDLSEWVDNRLPALCGALRTTGGRRWHGYWPPEPGAGWAASSGCWTTTPRSEVRQPQLEMLSSPLVRLLEAADDKLCDEITASAARVRGQRTGVPDAGRCALPRPTPRRAAGLDTVARDCAERLGTIIARPLRDEDDWSIEWTGCGCGLCDTLGTFLGSRSRRNVAWPLATDGRRHVHTQIDSAGLPVRHQTRRQGRPYTLVLTKTDELFTRATNRAAQGRDRPGVADVNAG